MSRAWGRARRATKKIIGLVQVKKEGTVAQTKEKAGRLSGSSSLLVGRTRIPELTFADVTAWLETPSSLLLSPSPAKLAGSLAEAVLAEANVTQASSEHPTLGLATVLFWRLIVSV